MRDVERFFLVRTQSGRCLVLAAMIIIIFLLENLNFIPFNRNAVFIYVFKPIIWCFVILFIWLLPRNRYTSKLRNQGTLKWWTCYLAVIYIVLTYIGGLFEGLGKNPYDLSFGGILKNFLLFGTALVGRELMRAYLVNSIFIKKPSYLYVLIALLMWMSELSLNRLLGLGADIKTVQYICEYLLPQLSISIMATYLVYIGGPVLSITYVGILQSVTLFSPILPDLKWVTRALIGILAPFFSYLLIQYIYLKESKEFLYRNLKKENPMGWMVTGILSISIVWFTVGVFPIYPSAIATGSMEPLIEPGDIILVKKIPSAEVKLGDIIQFKRGNILISHRVIEIMGEGEGEGSSGYRTKGDNNSSADSEIVKPEDIKGRVVKIVPNIGWPSLIFKSKQEVPKEQVEF